MPKRGYDEEDGSKDPPEVIQGRRKAKVNPRFRVNGASTGGEPGAMLAPFAGVMPPAPQTGFVFGTMGVEGGTNGVASKRSPPPSSFRAPPGEPTAYLGAERSPPAAGGGLHFLSSAAPARSATTSVVSSGSISSSATFPGLSSTAAVPSPQPDPQEAVASTPAVVATPSGPRVDLGSRTSAVPARATCRPSGPAFGQGSTAAQGARLNGRFVGWMSHHLQANSASRLEVGLRDYIAFAAQIRHWAELSTDDTAPACGAAFTHSVEPHTPIAAETDRPLVAVAATAASPAAASAFAPPVVAPTSSPPAASVAASALVPAPTFSFGSPSTLPPASASSAKFSFKLPSARAATPAAGPASTSLIPSGLNFNSKAFGFSAAPPVQSQFNGFQIPGGGAIAPPAPAAVAEEDDIPKEDPSKLQRAEGEEQEQIVHQVRAKLYKFKKHEAAWGDMGVGVLRLMKHNTTDARRLVLRNDMGKVLLNVALYESMKVSVVKNTIKFVANVEGAGPSSLMIKVKADGISSLHTKLLEMLPSP